MEKEGKRPRKEVEECGSCLRGAEGRLTSVWLRLTYLGFPDDSPAAKRRLSRTAKSEREEWIRREAAPSFCCLSTGDPWGRGLRRRDQRRSEEEGEAVCEQI